MGWRAEMNKAQGRQNMRLKLRMVKWTTAMALFVTPVVYMVATPLLVHATFPGLKGRISFARLSSGTKSTSIFSVRSDGSGEQQRPQGAAVWRVHLVRLGRSVEIMRVNCKVVVSLAPSARNPNSEVVSSVFDMPARG
jgi:hypothetical protein